MDEMDWVAQVVCLFGLLGCPPLSCSVCAEGPAPTDRRVTVLRVLVSRSNY